MLVVADCSCTQASSDSNAREVGLGFSVLHASSAAIVVAPLGIAVARSSPHQQPSTSPLSPFSRPI